MIRKIYKFKFKSASVQGLRINWEISKLKVKENGLKGQSDRIWEERVEGE